MNTTHMMDIFKHQLELYVLAATFTGASHHWHKWQRGQIAELPATIRIMEPFVSRQAMLRELVRTQDRLQEKVEEVQAERVRMKGAAFEGNESQARALAMYDSEITMILHYRDELERFIRDIKPLADYVHPESRGWS